METTIISACVISPEYIKLVNNSWSGLYQDIRKRIKGTDVLPTITENKEGDKNNTKSCNTNIININNPNNIAFMGVVPLPKIFIMTNA